MRKIDKIATLAVVPVSLCLRVSPARAGPDECIGIGDLPAEVIVETAVPSTR